MELSETSAGEWEIASDHYERDKERARRVYNRGRPDFFSSLIPRDSLEMSRGSDPGALLHHEIVRREAVSEKETSPPRPDRGKKLRPANSRLPVVAATNERTAGTAESFALAPAISSQYTRLAM